MEKIILDKELANKLMGISGEVRGVCMKADIEFLIKEKGKEGLKRLEEESASLGYPIKYKEIASSSFYPIGLEVLNMLIIWKIFDYKDDKVRQMAYEAPKFSIFLKLFLKYFFSMRETLKQSQKMWREHYTIGDLSAPEIEEEKRYAVLRLENFDLHKVVCVGLEGFFKKACQMMIKEGSPTCQETKCSFKGDNYHEFLIKW